MDMAMDSLAIELMPTIIRPITTIPIINPLHTTTTTTTLGGIEMASLLVIIHRNAVVCLQIGGLLQCKNISKKEVGLAWIIVRCLVEIQWIIRNAFSNNDLCNPACP